MSPEIELLYEEVGTQPDVLTAELREVYGGRLALSSSCLVANFVSTLDGVVALPGVARATRLISDEAPADRFILALLRAMADGVLIGAGTLRAHPHTTWTPQSAYEPLSAAFTALRHAHGREPYPRVIIVSSTGELDLHHPALRERNLVVSTAAGAARLQRSGFDSGRIIALPGEDHVEIGSLREILHERGVARIVSEAGPHLFASLLREGLVDEMFLTQSPLLAGRGDTPTLGLVERWGALPKILQSSELVSVRRAGSHLLLRHRILPSRAHPSSTR